MVCWVENNRVFAWCFIGCSRVFNGGSYVFNRVLFSALLEFSRMFNEILEDFRGFSLRFSMLSSSFNHRFRGCALFLVDYGVIGYMWFLYSVLLGFPGFQKGFLYLRWPFFWS